MDPAQWVGRDIDGRYRILSVLGVGGMGTVLRAQHQFTGVAVALKILHPQFQVDPDVQSRFLAEAQAPNAIDHPAVVRVTDAGRTSEGTLYMAMELLVGRSLRAAVTARDLSPDQIKRVLAELLAALGQAHARGFVHRDLKPDNVFLCAPGGDVKLLDFGIAKVLDDARRRTAAGALLGTPAYMAPEQLADASNVDSRADLWAAGVMLFEMITGRLPLAGTTISELMVAVASGAVIPIRQVMPSVSPELERFFTRALAVDPRRRFGAAVEMAQAIAPLTWGTAPSPVLNAGQVATVAPHAGSTVASHAPVAVAPQAPMVVAPPAPISPVTTEITPSSSKVPLILAAFAIVAIVAVVVVIAMGGKQPGQVATAGDARTSEPPREPVRVPTADPPKDAAVPDVMLLPLPDAGPKKVRDAGTPPRDALTTITQPTQPTQPDATIVEAPLTCGQRCERLAKRCGTQLPSCQQDCENRATDFIECFDRSERNCNDGAICGFAKICGGGPAGSDTCGQVAACQGQCAVGDVRCNCTCDRQLAPQHALALGRFNACFLRAFARGCTTVDCAAQQCPREVQACR